MVMISKLGPSLVGGLLFSCAALPGTRAGRILGRNLGIIQRSSGRLARDGLFFARRRAARRSAAEAVGEVEGNARAYPVGWAVARGGPACARAQAFSAPGCSRSAAGTRTGRTLGLSSMTTWAASRGVALFRVRQDRPR